MILKNHQDRARANQLNRQKILDFLLLHRYSTLKNISYELGHKSTAATSRILKRLRAERMVKKEVINENFTNITLFGLTSFGVECLTGEINKRRCFYKSKVNIRNISHTLVNQRIGIRYTKTDKIFKVVNMEFGSLSDNVANIKFKHRPDLLITAGKTNWIIETELSIKDKARYYLIWHEYMELKRSGRVDVVTYWVQDELAKKKLGKILTGLLSSLKRQDEKTSDIDKAIKICVMSKGDTDI